MKKYYVYILKCKDDSYYVGITNNIERREAEHNKGVNPESYTYFRRPVELIWQKEFLAIEEAIKFEKRIKGWTRRKKEALINEKWDDLVDLSLNYTEYGKKKNE